MTFYIKQTNQFIANGVDDKTLRQQLKEQGLDARRLVGSLSSLYLVRYH